MSNVILRKLPYAIRGFSAVDDNGEQIVVINSLYTMEMNEQTYLHEVSHYEDFYLQEVDIDRLEMERHLQITIKEAIRQ